MKPSKFIAVLLLFVMYLYTPAWAYTFSTTRKESPKDFNSFLDSCTQAEKRLMFQALRGDQEKTASPSEIRKALVWRAYNKTTYMFRSDTEVDYHEIVQWAAEEQGISKSRVNNAPTYSLEKEITEKYFAKLWEELPPEKRQELIDNVVKKEGSKVTANIGRALSDPNQYEYMAEMMAANPEAALAAAGGVYAVLTYLGPVGWVAMAAGGVWMAGSEVDTVSAFIMTVNLIKTQKYVK